MLWRTIVQNLNKDNKKRGMKCVVPASHTNDLRMETKASFHNVISHWKIDI